MKFEVKAKFEKVLENGMQKKVTELYIVDAISCTEAESIAIDELKPFMSGEFRIPSIKEANFSKVHASDDLTDDRWYKMKLAFTTLDEKSGVEKKVYSYMLVQAASTAIAEKRTHEIMKGPLSSYEIVSCVETKVVDVY